MADNTFTKQDGSFTRTLPTPKNLYEYYQSQGRTLPSVAERATMYGDANYTGTAEQNTAQLSRLLNPATSQPSVVQTPTGSQTTPIQTQQPITDNPYDAFNLLLQDKLKQAQSINTTDLLKQQRELQRQRIAKMQGTGNVAPTTEELRFLSPSQQSAIRSSDVNILTPAIDETAYQITRANQDRKDLIEQIQFARESGDNARASALDEEYNKADQAYKEAVLAENIRSNKANEVIAGQKASSTGTDMSGMPNSWKEWTMAGEPGTYQDWVRKTGLRPLPPTQTTTLSEGFQIPLVTNSISAMLDENSPDYKGDLFGPVEGLWAKNPWDTEHKTIDDDLRRASQVIGRYMEGGVLRKEDEEKYRKMLPQITDTVTVAKDKLSGVKTLLAAKSQQYLTDYEAAGFDVSNFVGKLPGTEGSKSSSLKDQVDSAGYDYEQMKADGYSDEQIKESLGFSMVGGDTKTAQGNLPQRNLNPGNIKKGGIADSLSIGSDIQGHLMFPDEQTGFKAMEMDLQAKINGQSKYLPANPTLAQLGKVYAEDKTWADKVAKILGVSSSTSTKQIPISSLVQAIARQEGYYA